MARPRCHTPVSPHPVPVDDATLPRGCSPRPRLDYLMLREIRDVRRCSRCQAVVCALVHDKMLDDAGEAVEAVYWLPRRKHTDDDCSRQLTLNDEQWPRLFEMDY